MKESKQTKSCKRKKIFFSILHFLLLFGPLMFFFPYGFAIGTAVTKISITLFPFLRSSLAVSIPFLPAI